MKFLKIFLLVILVLAIIYLLGPRPATPSYSRAFTSALTAQNASSGTDLDNKVAAEESKHKLKPDNEARIIWYNDSLKQPTDYAIVYLHGFSASQKEGDPVHKDIAKKFGCNLFLARLADHGIDTTEALMNFTVDHYWQSAEEAINIGEQLGKKLIIMATSTGGSLALKLAETYGSRIHALILLSPNISIFDKNAWLLNNPWGLQIARMVVGSKYVDGSDVRPIYRQYWYYHYRLEGAVQLEEFLETSMTKETFQKVKQPTLLMYYYKDEVHQDSVVSVAAMKKMFEELGTSSSMKRSVDLPNAGNHVIGSFIKSKDVEGVERETEKFMTEVLGMKPVAQ